MRKVVLACGFLVATTSAAAQDGPLRGLDAFIQESMADWRVPGLSLAVILGDSLIYAAGYGVKQINHPDPVDAATIFQVGSTSKALTAAAAGALVDKAVLQWDDRVIDHLPWFRLSDPWVTANVTLRDLLVHRVGLGSWIHNVNPWSTEEVVRRLRHVPFSSPFRQDHFYSNVMYGTAGLVIGAAGGSTWDEVLHARILEPLGMRDTNTDPYAYWQPGAVASCFDCGSEGPATLERAKAGANIAMPHMRYGDSIVAIPWRSYAGAAAAGAVNSNALDMARWVTMLLNRGRIDGRQVLSESTVDTMLSTQISRPPRNAATPPDAPPNFSAYGFGWRLESFRGRRLVWHTGGVSGFLAYVALMPEENLGVVVLANRDGWLPPHRSLLPFAIGTWIFDRFLGHDPGNPSQHLLQEVESGVPVYDRAQRALRESRIVGTAPPYPLESYAGVYADAALGTVRLTLGADALELDFPGGATARIEHWHHDLFRAHFAGPRRFETFVRFQADRDGRISRLEIEGMADFERVPEP